MKEIIYGSLGLAATILVNTVYEFLFLMFGIATGYGLDCPGIESRWRRDFPRPSRPVLGPSQYSIPVLHVWSFMDSS